MAATTAPRPTKGRRRVVDVAGVALVAALAIGLVVLAIDGFTADDASSDRVVATGSDSVESRIAGFSFESLTIAVGATVTWVNDDPSAHTVTAADGAFDSGLEDPLEEGDAFRAQFVTPGQYTVICSIHPDMVGRVTVIEESSP